MGICALNIYQFEVHTKTKMYSIMAAYFIANPDGVMFFDDKQKGIGFAPNENLELVRLSPLKPIDWSEVTKADDILLSSAKAIFDR